MVGARRFDDDDDNTFFSCVGHQRNEYRIILMCSLIEYIELKERIELIMKKPPLYILL